MRASVEEHRATSEPILKIAFLDEPVGENPTARLEGLKEAHERLKGLLKEVATMSSIQALALVKSHYPRVDLRRIGKGFAADADDNKIKALLSEIKPTSELLVSQQDMEAL